MTTNAAEPRATPDGSKVPAGPDIVIVPLPPASAPDPDVRKVTAYSTAVAPAAGEESATDGDNTLVGEAGGAASAAGVTVRSAAIALAKATGSFLAPPLGISTQDPYGQSRRESRSRT
jgi:hypothetical protein